METGGRGAGASGARHRARTLRLARWLGVVGLLVAAFVVEVGPAGAADSDLTLINVPANITTAATQYGGAVVTYTLPTFNDEDSDAVVSCTPNTGSFFSIGTTTVTCIANDPNDDTNNPVTATFTVTVTGVVDACYNPLTAALDKVSTTVARSCGSGETFVHWAQDASPAPGTAVVHACVNSLTAALDKVSLGVARLCGTGETAVTWDQGANAGLGSVYACYNPTTAALNKVSLSLARTCGTGETAVVWSRLP